jgi:hypothetical protein
MVSYEIENNLYVMKVEQVDTGTQIATVKTFYDMLTWIILSATPNPSTVNSTVTLTATFQNYDGGPATNVPENVTFEIDGATQTVPVTNGQAQTTLTASVAGTHTVQCYAPNVKPATVEVVFQ